MLRNLKVGIFDSGIGGLSVLSEIVTLLPNISISYIADDLFCPYGAKSEQQIIERSNTIVSQLLEFDVDLIVLACNTATAWAIADLRSRHELPFVGIEPFLNINNHHEYDQVEGRFVALTTAATGRSNKFRALKKKLDPDDNIAHYCLSELATLIETVYKDGVDEDLIASIEKELAPLKNKRFDYAILGCTHYPLIARKIESYLGVKTINPARFVALRVRDLLMQIDPVALDQGPLVEEFTFISTCEAISKSYYTREFSADNINII